MTPAQLAAFEAWERDPRSCFVFVVYGCELPPDYTPPTKQPKRKEEYPPIVH